MPRPKGRKRLKLEEYDLIFSEEKKIFNPNTGRTVPLSSYWINKIYNSVIEEERERRRQPSDSLEPDYDIWFPNMTEGLLRLKGQQVTLSWDNTINTTFRVPETKNSIRREIAQRGFLRTSDLTIFEQWRREHNGDYPPRVEVTIINNVDPVRISQRFRDGIDHCVFEPIKRWALEKKENAIAKKTKKNYNTFYNKAVKLEKEYNIGVPQEDIQKVCNTLQIGLDITLPLLKDSFISYRSTKKPLKIFRFINTRLNHVELGGIVGENNTIVLDNYNELLDKRDELEAKNEYYIFTKGGQNLTSITTLYNKYIVKTEYKKAKDLLENLYQLWNYKIDDIKDEELSGFVNEGTHYNETIDFKRPTEHIRHIDQEKAYFNFWICKYYNGLLGKITDFRKTNKMLKDDDGYIPALYRIYNLNFSNCKYTKLLNKLGCYKNYNVYPSCELEFLLDIGITFNVIEGCWGVKRLHFRFPEVLKEKDNKVSHYARYVGTCDCHRLENRIWLKGDKNFFENIQSYTNEPISYNDDLHEGCISFKKQHSYHFGHLTAFITSLQRINCIEQMMKFNYNNLIRVCVDGIYFMGDMPELVNLFREKYDINLKNKAGNCYCSNIYDDKIEGKWDSLLPDYKENIQEELHLGAGGTGKTHKALTDKGLQRVLYVAPSYKLASKKKEEYNIDSTCWEQLLCKDITVWSKYLKYYNTLIFDEVSMMSKNQLKDIRERFDTCKVILCGDLGYQLPCFNNENIETSDFKNIVHYNKNYRVKCDKLSLLLSTLRENMNEWTGYEHLKYIVDNYKDRIITKIDNYNINDYILTYTNSLKDKYTEMFKDTFEEEKYIFKERYDKYFNGSIAILPKNNNVKGKKEVRHAFTIHSIQGETVEMDKKLFIDTNLFNCSIDGKLLYTAISRAKRLEQIYFIV